MIEQFFKSFNDDIVVRVHVRNSLVVRVRNFLVVRVQRFRGQHFRVRKVLDVHGHNFDHVLRFVRIQYYVQHCGPTKKRGEIL